MTFVKLDFLPVPQCHAEGCERPPSLEERFEYAPGCEVIQYWCERCSAAYLKRVQAVSK